MFGLYVRTSSPRGSQQLSTNLIAIGPRRAPWRPAALRAALVTMAAVLAAYGTALWLEHRAHLHLDIVITAVAMTLTLGRVQLGADRRDRLIGATVLAISAAGASEVSSLLQRHPFLGDAAFTLAMAGTIWIRRYGRQAAKAGAVMIVPFVTLLLTQGQGVFPHNGAHDLWSALIALVAAFWVAVFQVGAAALGFHEQRIRQPAPASLTAPSQGSAKRVPASTRMACQMAVALGAAFAVGHLAFHEHWPWAVLTAFIVCSSARGRGDVLHKGVLRAVGAAVGTVVGTVVSGAFPPADRWSVVIIFVVLALAGWLREISYAFWAGSVTAALSLLYGYFGQSAPPLLETRLEAILAGAAVGIAASWFVMPIRTGGVLKRRVAEALAALGRFLGAPLGDQAEIRRREAHFRHAVTQLEQIAKPLRAQRFLARSGARADVIDAVHDCVEPVGTLAGIFAAADAEDGGAQDAEVPEWEPLRRAVASNVGAIRRALGRNPDARLRAGGPAGRSTAAGAALTALDSALARLGAIYGLPPSAQNSREQVGA